MFARSGRVLKYGLLGAGLTTAGLFYTTYNSQSVQLVDLHKQPNLLPVDYQAMNKKRKTLKYKSRAEHLANAKKTEEFDVIIIGGGSVGAGVALNTSGAGLNTIVIEANDFGTGTSSKSTKLLHGGSQM